MNGERTRETGNVSTCVIGESVLEDRTYRLIRISMPKVSSKTRNKILERILDEENGIGLMEWWDHGSIINKPKHDFYIIIIVGTK
jgi:hypothetical protein